MAAKKHSPLPGFGLTLGFTLFYLSAVVLIPLAALTLRASELSWADFWKLATTERALAAYRLTFGASLIAACINAVFGTLLAWVLTRYDFPGRRLLDALWPLLAAGGRLVYATCSVLPDENADQIAAFLARTPAAVALDAVPHGFGRASGAGRQNLPGEGGMDGFFYAVVEKRA